MELKGKVVTGVKVVICGSRSLDEWDLVEAFVDAVTKALEGELVFCHGCAKGVDSMAGYLLKKKGYEVVEFPANWENGKGAGFARNWQMAAWGDHVFALWDGKSRGTEHMIECGKRLGRKVHVWKVKAKKKT